MLQDLKPAQKQLIIPNVAQDGIKINDQNDYYSKLVADYVELNNRIEDNKVKIELLEKSKIDIKTPNDEAREILDKKLDNLVKKLNKIIEDMNALSKEYVDSAYSDMIKVISPVATVTEGKPLILFVGVGVVLGVMFGIFSAFMKEFMRGYRKKYSK